MSLLAAPPLGIAAAGQAAVLERSVAEAIPVHEAEEVAEVPGHVVDDLTGPSERFALLASNCTHLGRVQFARHLNASFLERRLLLGATDQPDQNHNRDEVTHPASVPPELAERLRRELFNEQEGDAEERAWRRGWNRRATSLLRDP